MTVKEWIIEQLEKSNYDTTKVYKNYDMLLRDTDSEMSYESFTRKVRMIKKEIMFDNFDEESVDSEELTELFIKQKANQQKLLDLNSVEKKINRESFRVYNSLEELFDTYIAQLQKTDLTKFKIKEHKVSTTDKIGIVHISDTHFNEIIEQEDVINGNYYDFVVASKRLKKYIDRCCEEIKFRKIKTVYIFLTGDLMNSNRRLSEKMAQCSSLVSASLLATQLLMQVIVQLNKLCNVKVASVVGNESRLDEDMDHSDILASNNWDFLIFNNLRNIFAKTKGIEFIKSKSLSKTIVSFSNGFNALLLHGDTMKGSYQKALRLEVSNYALRGIKIHGVFTGHYHNGVVGDYGSQAGSLCGSNSYSEVDLKYLSRASQNFYIVNEDLSYDGIKIDLQHVQNYEGYDINEELEYYNVRSSKENVQIISKNLV